jgi:hypothetical protein
VDAGNHDSGESPGAQGADEHGGAGVVLAHTVVAPVFSHGNGRGATGCVMVSPPAFLSEDEALQIIGEELAEYGVELGPESVVGGVTIAPRYHRLVGEWGQGPIIEDSQSSKPFEIDAVDPELGVAVEFVSAYEYEEVGGLGSGAVELDPRGNIVAAMESSVESYDFKECAEHIARRIEDQGLTPVHVGVFYDPMAELNPLEERMLQDMSGTWEQIEAARRKKSRELLREQVRDFVEWLEAQESIS